MELYQRSTETIQGRSQAVTIKTGEVADKTLPYLITLVMARKQARWQWANCAGEHKYRWSLVIAQLDTRIAKGEAALARRMEMAQFRIKREVVE